MWKSVEIPNVGMLIQKILDVVEMDVLTERLGKGDVNRIKQIWEIFYEWLDM